MTTDNAPMTINRRSYDLGEASLRLPEEGYLHLRRRPDQDGGPYGLIGEEDILELFKRTTSPDNLENPNHRVWAGPGGQRLVYGSNAGYDDQVKSMFASAQDATIEAWSKRIQAMEYGQNYTILTNDPQSFGQNDKALMRRLTTFVRPILNQLGHPPNGCRSFCFTGRYPLTPFGVHIEDFHSFFFPIVGHRRIYMWPAEYPSTIGDTTFSNATDLSPWLDDAIIFDIGPGDMMYWSPKMWHVLGSPDPLEAHVTFSVLWRDHWNAQQLPNPSKQFKTIIDLGERIAFGQKTATGPAASAVFKENGHATLPKAVHEIVETWKSMINGRPLIAELWRHRLAQVSGSSFLWAEDFGPMPEVEENDQFTAQPDVDLHWVNLGEGRALWAASSKVFEIDAAWLPALRQIASGVIVTPAILAETASGTLVDALELVQKCLWVDAVTEAS